MTPAARVQAAIEILSEILEGAPAEKSLSNWARRSRFAGSKDRAAIRDHVFQALRCRRSYAALGGAMTGRGLMLGALRDAGGDAAQIFSGDAYAPAPLTEAEQQALCAPAAEDDLWDLPDWLIAAFHSSLGERAKDTALALRERAPVMLRVNLQKATLEQAERTLQDDGIKVEPDPVASGALKVTDGARRVSGSQAYLNGMVELQDGSSQAAMEYVHLDGPAKVLDYCAGGGGKTLALAGRGAGGQWFAHDAVPQRMKDLPDRAMRAGVKVTRLQTNDVAGKTPFDLVLCDVPCSGSGTWRRTPEAKWALTPARLAELEQTQARILQQAAEYVSDTGALVYTTCSVLSAENEAQIDRFLDANPRWSCIKRHCWPVSQSGDGFFLAILRCLQAADVQS